MLENRVETRLRLGVKKLGGNAVKFVSPGNSGVNDRLVLLPGARTIFVELKAPGKKRSPLQLKWAKDLEKMGFHSHCLDTLEKVDQFLKEIQS